MCIRDRLVGCGHTTTSLPGRKCVSVRSLLCRGPKLIRVAYHINKLTSVPEEVGAMVSLKASTWHRNELKELPPGIGNLKSLAELALFTNQLVSLPDEFCRLSKLTELWLYDNRLESLPEAIGNLSSLRYAGYQESRMMHVAACVLDEPLACCMTKCC